MILPSDNNLARKIITRVRGGMARGMRQTLAPPRDKVDRVVMHSSPYFRKCLNVSVAIDPLCSV